MTDIYEEWVAQFKWTITRDVLHEQMSIGPSRVGSGNNNGSVEGLSYKWRTSDEECCVHYEGYSNDNCTEAAFIPLEWSMCDTGATDIEFWDPVIEVWEYL